MVYFYESQLPGEAAPGRHAARRNEAIDVDWISNGVSELQARPPIEGEPPGRALTHSHSIVPGGFDVMSYTTRFTPLTSLMMRVATRPRKAWS